MHTSLTCTATSSSRLSACTRAPDALGSGTACCVEQAQYYNQAFGIFFQRLAANGITPKNTLFIISSDEADHQAGADIGRAIQPARLPATVRQRAATW
jgi:hypothetical protein